jgi:hypothetical protein
MTRIREILRSTALDLGDGDVPPLVEKSFEEGVKVCLTMALISEMVTKAPDEIRKGIESELDKIRKRVVGCVPPLPKTGPILTPCPICATEDIPQEVAQKECKHSNIHRSATILFALLEIAGKGSPDIEKYVNDYIAEAS